MSQLKGPPMPLTGNVAAAARAARTAVQRDNNRQVKNTQLGAAAKAQNAAASATASSSSTSGSSKAGAERAGSNAPKGSSQPKAPSSQSGQKAPAAPGPKLQGAPKVRPASEELKAAEVGELESGGSDSFTQDTSALNDLRRLMGAVDEHTSGTSAMTKEHDIFDPNLSAPEVENLGSLRGAVHMVKLMDHWNKSGVGKSTALQDAAALLLSFSRPEAARGVLRELDRAPIKSIYPLEVQMTLVDLVPDFFPNVSRGSVVENKDALERGDRVLAGHDARVHFPTTMKLKAFALLTEGRPGYEFEPLRPGLFRLLVDTPGQWTFAIRGEEQGKAVIDTFTVNVRAPGARTQQVDEEDTSMREVVIPAD